MQEAKINHTYTIGARTSLERFRPGHEVRAELLPLDDYDFSDPDDPVPALVIRDVPLIAAGEMVGIITESSSEKLSILDEETGLTHTWFREHLTTVTTTAIRGVSEFPAEYSLPRRDSWGGYETPVNIGYIPGTGFTKGTRDDAPVIAVDGLLGIASALGLGDKPRAVTKVQVGGVRHSVVLDLENDAVRIGCWRVGITDARAFLEWVLERVDGTATA